MTKEAATDHSTAPAGAQALYRGLAAMEAVAAGARSLSAIGEAIGCTRSTTHRLLDALQRAGYLRRDSDGYALGARLIDLGYQARASLPLIQAARPHLESLAASTRDTVHLGVRDGSEVLYLDKLPGVRGLEMRSRIGNRMPLAVTGLGKALLLDLDHDALAALHAEAMRHRDPATLARTRAWPAFLAGMRRYSRLGFAFDLEENEVGIRCVAAPVRDASGAIQASVSVASARPYMPKTRMQALVPEVLAAARAISIELGWRPR
ncbi:IclR family transcriptional regulator [Vitiosangium sp. GDMCC 1.1324]|uniref:IclR family transcriptional regulator n=1 Tax=Vitiosangium sp. (strain GDMCC 1.1324) TaxID=2138576 RepID=UPI0018EE70D0|nr:IclR family transcriptional regulator [Vitiosangium sp. GDMCC 1.1324]